MAGDAVIQNAANSGVGLAVIQIARHMRIPTPTINIIRRRYARQCPHRPRKRIVTHRLR